MTDSLAAFARLVGELVGMSGELFDRRDFAGVLARGCAGLCAGSEVGVVLLGHGGEPTVSAGSTPAAAELEAVGVHRAVGAAVEAMRAGSVSVRASVDDGRRWDAYGIAARQAGYHVVHSFVLANNEATIGVIDFFTAVGTDAPGAELMLSLAQIAATHLNREAELRAARTLAAQLETALASRVVIEQAKGVLAERSRTSVESAFHALRRHARGHNQRLTELCETIASRAPDADVEVSVSPMTAARREALSDRAIARWRQVHAESREYSERAQAAVSRSAELRLEVDQQRAVRETEAILRSVDRRSRDSSRTHPEAHGRPRVLVGTSSESARAFVIDVLGSETRMDLLDSLGSGMDALGCSIVEQPDLVILGGEVIDSTGPQLGDFRHYCPDSRLLVVVDQVGDISRVRGRGVHGIVVRGDRESLIERALELCGVRAPRRS